jgi:hypothetical protein
VAAGVDVTLADVLELLHPDGVLQIQALFVRDIDQYSSFRGPGKLEGSIVNWLNGPVFGMVGERVGYRVALEPFSCAVASTWWRTTERPPDVND